MPWIRTCAVRDDISSLHPSPNWLWGFWEAHMRSHIITFVAKGEGCFEKKKCIERDYNLDTCVVGGTDSQGQFGTY
jgi:hypothetical protein